MNKRLMLGYIFLVLALIGCASSSSRVTKTETISKETVRDDSTTEGNKGNFSGGESSPETKENRTATVVEKKTEIKEQRRTSESRGILGTTLHFVGQIIAFPFRIIAGVIEFIF